jgi:hypothetical protein
VCITTMHNEARTEEAGSNGWRVVRHTERRQSERLGARRAIAVDNETCTEEADRAAWHAVSCTKKRWASSA